MAAFRFLQKMARSARAGGQTPLETAAPAPLKTDFTLTADRLLQKLYFSASDRRSLGAALAAALTNAPGALRPNVEAALLTLLQLLQRPPFASTPNAVLEALAAALELLELGTDVDRLANPQKPYDANVLAINSIQIPLTSPASVFTAENLQAALLLQVVCAAARCAVRETDPEGSLSLYEAFAPALLLAAVSSLIPPAIDHVLVAMRRMHADAIKVNDNSLSLRLFVTSCLQDALCDTAARRILQPLKKAAAPTAITGRIDSAAHEPSALFALLQRAGVVQSAHTTRRWLDDGEVVRESLWELTPAFAARLWLYLAPEVRAHVQRRAYDYLQLEADSAFASVSYDAPPKARYLPVLHGCVAASGINDWQKALLNRTLLTIEGRVAKDPSAAAFYGVKLSRRQEHRIAYEAAPGAHPVQDPARTGKQQEKESPLSQTDAESTPNAADQMVARIEHLKSTYLAAVELTNTRSAQGTALGARETEMLPAPAAGLFLPTSIFPAGAMAGIESLEAQGLAVTAVRVQNEDGTAAYAPLKRHRDAAADPVEGVLLAHFETLESARWWLEGPDAGFAYRAGERERSLRRFLQTDAMVRTLRTLLAEDEAGRQQKSAQVLLQGAPLMKTLLTPAVTKALSQVLKPRSMRKVKNATAVSLLDGFLKNAGLTRDPEGRETDLAALLREQAKIQKAANSKRVRRMRCKLEAENNDKGSQTT